MPKELQTARRNHRKPTHRALIAEQLSTVLDWVSPDTETASSLAEWVTAGDGLLPIGGGLQEAVGQRLAQELDAHPGELEGTRVGPIEVGELLGRGGMGEVYRGFDPRLGRAVAVKCMRRDRQLSKEAKARARREAQILSRLSHPAICQIYDLQTVEAKDFLIIELVEGLPLDEWLSGEAEEVQVLSIVEQILEGLVAAHGEGVVHRDLKPANIMMTDGGKARVLDFGIARSAGSVRAPDGSQPEQADEENLALTRGGVLLGTIS